ncbi:PTS sugar transporter subunit IIC [Ligilactobacillus agilis]|uniref:Permease IIC component n=2 Tax=Ligilactobacillus agilis TaxID=1601 RepID=A0A6F9XKV0_9LACO|nr:PTS sugar transporter subunit IIC [Ligilactobacillus agilis]MBM6762622.1 PTS sugar transporter subunit IIC [Ligilactobacillus agilis]MCL8205813.1 PTS sugar transporter subunit IIC [Ligilactobacillus agilis]MDY4065192.1 PTS sugar transporter subunit IIC [Ligilactobacillus agilis]UNL42375.1 PTS sugar transporter subunit IIC [Ligilactobacillus agilis]UNL57435.1 PTS sugar transporter subunit IIC [Ligilactobacillus agilis]
MENSKFVDKFATFAGKLGSQIHLRTLRDAFATVMPLYILAGLAVLLNNTVFTWIFKGQTLTNVQYWGTVITNGTLNISGLLIAVMIGYYMAQNREFENPLAVAMVTLASLVTMMPNTVAIIPDGAKKAVDASGLLPFTNIGTGAMFAGVIVGLLASELFIKLSRIEKLQVNLGDNVPPAVGKSFNVLIPVILVVSIFAFVSAILYNLTGMNLINLITTFIQEPLRHIGTGLWGCLILYSLGNLLWLFGIHHSVIYSSILEPLLIINITENIAAYNAGKAIPNIINVSQIQVYALMGGSGSTLCLLIATLLVSRSAAARNVAKLSIGPGIFNINEPVIFGYPIVYNISMAIPFVGVPALGILISYFATKVGLMGPAVIQVPWTTPVFINSFLATAGDWRSIIVQAVILVLGVLIYMPFVKVNDKVSEGQFN